MKQSQFNSQVWRKLDMGRFHDVTTSTMDRGNSIFRGLDTVISLQNTKERRENLLRMWIQRSTIIVPVQFTPFQVLFLLGEACPSQSRGGLAQITNKIIAEVEGHGVLIGQQPPGAKNISREGNSRILLFNFRVKTCLIIGFLHRKLKNVLCRSASEGNKNKERGWSVTFNLKNTLTDLPCVELRHVFQEVVVNGVGGTGVLAHMWLHGEGERWGHTGGKQNMHTWRRHLQCSEFTEVGESLPDLPPLFAVNKPDERRWELSCQQLKPEDRKAF